MTSKKLSRDEAEEYTRNIGQVTVGNFGLMEFAMHTLKVPEALGMTNEEWVEQRLGGYIRWSVKQRQQAIKELSGEKSEGGYYEKSAKQVAEILGISENTVQRDRGQIEVQQASLDAPEDRNALAEASHEASVKLTTEERRAEVERLAAYGKSNAEIAVELGVNTSTVQKDRAAIKKAAEKDRQPSEALQQARDEKADNAPPEADQKANEAVLAEDAEEVTKDLASAMRMSPAAYIHSAIESMERVGEIGHEIQNFEECVAAYVRLGNLLWEHGAMRGFDVSDISEALRRFEEDR